MQLAKHEIVRLQEENDEIRTQLEEVSRGGGQSAA